MEDKKKTIKKVPVKKAVSAVKSKAVSKVTKSKVAPSTDKKSESSVKKVVSPVAKTQETVKSTAPKAKKADLSKFAVIKIGGTQIKVSENVTYEVDRIEGNKGDKVVNNEVLLIVDGEDVKIGKPTVANAKVEYEIAGFVKTKKIDGFKYKAKARYRKHFGSRSVMSRIAVKKIVA